jgi:putative holliday junction resolvase
VTPATGTGRVVAFDPGTARIGVAVCDADRTMAFPRAPVAVGPDAIVRCAAIAREEAVEVVVVGLPLQLDGTEGTSAAGARSLATALTSQLADVEVVLHDERMTTVTASGRLREAGLDERSARGRVDGAAAVVLLESWLAT